MVAVAVGQGGGNLRFTGAVPEVSGVVLRDIDLADGTELGVPIYRIFVKRRGVSGRLKQIKRCRLDPR